VELVKNGFGVVSGCIVKHDTVWSVIAEQISGSVGDNCGLLVFKIGESGGCNPMECCAVGGHVSCGVDVWVLCGTMRLQR